MIILHTYLLAITQLKDWVNLSAWSALHNAVLGSHELPSGISAGQFLLVTHLCCFFIDDIALCSVLRKKIFATLCCIHGIVSRQVKSSQDDVSFFPTYI